MIIIILRVKLKPEEAIIVNVMYFESRLFMVQWHFLVFCVENGIVCTIYQTGVNIFGLGDVDSIKISKVLSYSFCR